MLVYKYRGGDSKIIERDINSLEQNKFYAASIEDLNDPCEGITDTRRVQKPLKWIAKKIGMTYEEEFGLISSNTDKVLSIGRSKGIYSLSKTFLDELLWAHYANSHKGFCLEYDLNKLLANFVSGHFYSASVKYRTSPPKLGVLETLVNNEERMMNKFGFFKSRRWRYEQEHRIITNEIGFYNYPTDALKGIYFGLKMGDNQKVELMARLKSKNINFFQMKLEESSYKLYPKKL